MVERPKSEARLNWLSSYETSFATTFGQQTNPRLAGRRRGYMQAMLMAEDIKATRKKLDVWLGVRKKEL